jgi:hypothetical protein
MMLSEAEGVFKQDALISPESALLTALQDLRAVCFEL